MAEDSGQDKSEEPTAKRISDARKKGQVPRSKELDTFSILIISSVMFLFLGEHISQGLWQLMRRPFQLNREAIFDAALPLQLFGSLLKDAMLLVLPIMLVLVASSLITPMIIGGWNFSSQAIQPKLSKFNPLNGIKKIFGVQGVVELIKAIIKVALIFSVAYGLFNVYWEELLTLNNKQLAQGIARAAEILVLGFLIMCLTLLLVVMVDVPFQLWNNKRQLKMTKQEVKDECKESDGNPEIKGRIRQRQMDIAQRRMMAEVPKADVVVTNPTHFAVALKYDMEGSGAPIVVAKGTDLVAAEIRTQALGADVPLVAAPPLARALYYSTELNEQIPQGLFVAVAQILAYVFQLKAANENGGGKPAYPNNIDVPDEFRQS